MRRGQPRTDWGRSAGRDPWPTSDLLVARGMAYAETLGMLKPFALSAMRLSFLEGADLGERSAVLDAGQRAGMDPLELEQRPRRTSASSRRCAA